MLVKYFAWPLKANIGVRITKILHSKTLIDKYYITHSSRPTQGLYSKYMLLNVVENENTGLFTSARAQGIEDQETVQLAERLKERQAIKMDVQRGTLFLRAQKGISASHNK